MCRGELSLCMLVCAAVWYRRWGWRTKQHHLLSTKRKGLNWKYSMRYIYLSYNSFRMPCYFLIFILVLISVIVLMSSWKDSNKVINVEILISNENLKKVQFYNRMICFCNFISFANKNIHMQRKKQNTFETNQNNIASTFKTIVKWFCDILLLMRNTGKR